MNVHTIQISEKKIRTIEKIKIYDFVSHIYFRRRNFSFKKVKKVKNN